MRIHHDGETYYCEADYSERDLAREAGFRWNHDDSRWESKDDLCALKLKKYAKGKTLHLLQEAEDRISGSLDASRAEDSDLVIPAPMGLEYMPFQKAGIAYIVDKFEKGDCPYPGVLLADDMGLGKTIQAIGIINYYDDIENVLIICPASLKINWKRESQKWLVRDLSVAIATSTLFPPADIVIINYDILHNWEEKIRGLHLDLLIADESHRLKSKKARRTVQVVGGMTKYGAKKDRKCRLVKPIQADRKLLLSGTPIPNRPYEIFTVLKYMRPDVFSNQWQFVKNYCNGEWDGHSNLAEMQLKLRSTLMVRRLKADVLTELPPKVRQIIEVEAKGSSKALKAECDAWERHEATLDGLRAAVELAKADSEAQYKNAVANLREGFGVSFQEVSLARKEVALSKVPAVIEHVRSIVAEGHKCVVFIHHGEVCDLIYDAFKGHAVTLTGRLSNKQERQNRIDKFQTDPNCKVFIGSIGAAGVGITLTAASIVVFAELDWVPGNVSQAEDRCHRIGQHDSVLVQHLIVDGSLDAKMCHTIVAKQEIIDAALDDEIVTAEAISIPENRNTSTFGKRRQQIEKESLNITPPISRAIHAALKLVSVYCDGAQARDGAGFSRIDAEMGHSLANQQELTPKAAALGKYLVRKYRRQVPVEMLEKCGIENVLEPKKTEGIPPAKSPEKQRVLEFGSENAAYLD